MLGGFPLADASAYSVLLRKPRVEVASKVPAPEGVIHWWPLVSDENDVVGDWHLTNNGGVTFGPSGATFNGSNYLDILGRSESLPISITGWFNLSSTSQQIVWGSPTSGTTSFDYYMSCGVWSGSAHARCLGSVFTNVGGFSANAWTFIAQGSSSFVYYGSTMTTKGAGTYAFDDGFSIGRGYWASGYWYPIAGKVADVRIYNRTLSESECVEIKAAGPNP